MNSINKKINDFNNEMNNLYLNIIKKSNNYDFYSIDEENLNLTFISYYNSIYNSFNNYLEKYFNFSKNNDYHNSFTKSLRNIYNLQIIDYGEKIKQFSNNFNLELFNLSLSLDKLIIDELRKDYDNFEFSFLYNYIDVYINYENIYQNNFIDKINDLKQKTLDQFKQNYLSFISSLKNNNNNKYVSNNFITELNNNYTKCLNYSMDKYNEIILEDKLNWDKYKKNIELIENLNKSDEISNDFNNSYFNITEYLFYCNNNKYFNYSNIIIKKNELDDEKIKNKIINIIYEINMNIFNDSYLDSFLSNEFQLKIKENNKISIENLKTYFYFEFESFQEICNYLYSNMEQKYIDNLKQSLIKNFYISYSNFVEDYLVSEIDISFYINIIESINTKLNYIKKHIIEENDFFSLLLNHTEAIGITTKESLIQLYILLYENINNTSNDFLESIFNSNIKLLLKENKKIFFDSYIRYIKDNKNFYEIYQFDKYIANILDDNKFNTTLKNISYNLLEEQIMNKIKENMLTIMNSNMKEFYDLLYSLKNIMDNHLKDIIILNYSDDFIPIKDKNENFTSILNEQNYKYSFVVSERPFIVLDDFINSNLKSPLIYIELCYNKIENELMNKLIEKIDHFDNIYELIKVNLDLDNKVKMIENNYNITNNLFENYSNIITNDIIEIKTKLFNYTHINGLNKKNNKIRYLDELDKSKEEYSPKKIINIIKMDFIIELILIIIKIIILNLGILSQIQEKVLIIYII